jgi:hypothetical protein
MRATDKGNIFNRKQLCPFAITSGDTTNLSAAFTAKITLHIFSLLFAKNRDENPFACWAELSRYRYPLTSKGFPSLHISIQPKRGLSAVR